MGAMRSMGTMLSDQPAFIKIPKIELQNGHWLWADCIFFSVDGFAVLICNKGLRSSSFVK